MNKEVTNIFNRLVADQKKLKNADPYGANFSTLKRSIESNKTYLRDILQKSNNANWQAVYDGILQNAGV